MLQWKKLGCVFKNQNFGDWRHNSALQPTPLVLQDRVRFYVGFRDESGVSRIGFVDLSNANLTEILTVSEKPVLDIGVDGAFDEYGVVPCAITRVGSDIYMYYAGYQLGKKVRFLVFSGLAISHDGGCTFARYSQTPVFERTQNELLFRVPHSVIIENGVFKFWYGGGSNFIRGKEKTLPVYDVRYLESPDGVLIPDAGRKIINIKDDEYRIGRPYVIKTAGVGYSMFYGYSSEASPYVLGYASSGDGINWVRRDNEIGIGLSTSGWDSEMMAYPSIVKIKDKTFLFYNGNNYGYDGFGCAELVEGGV
ncbi:hypothetical protein [Castellaniella sp.]|uniref:hypothetical protein n=1 Tax=Castellaniella sp. TaxID=1955812 RepID=UPI002AFEE5CD|nr:hypothetical protein [Castellaniella sp.]